jgi:flagellar biosynthetic protein FliR
VTIGGHRRMIAALLSTFEVIPIGGGSLPPSLSETVTTLLGQSFALGVRAAAPAMTALLLSTLVMGLISRTLPQLNIMAFGFGLNAMVTLGALAVSLGAIAWIFQDQIDAVLETLPETLFRESAGEPSAGRMSHVPRRFA